MVEISLYGSGERPGRVTAPGYSTAGFRVRESPIMTTPRGFWAGLPPECSFAIAKFKKVIELNLALGFFAFLMFQLGHSRSHEMSAPVRPAEGAVAS